ncbi:MAG: hypothetical protein EAX81_07110 [Candidatus Thorarchaeota archaeon]|nr:hypothetical protein [Candidatus Thorarchaeota archaeon]
MDGLGSGELRLLRRVTISPRLRKAALAKELGISRSAITQLWDKLEYSRNLRIESYFDHGLLGLTILFGWAKAEEGSEVLFKFATWLRSNPLVSRVVESAISSSMDHRVYFEARLPAGPRGNWFRSQLARFEKRPYSLRLIYTSASHIAHHMNLGLFDGSQWDFDVGFRFTAAIDMARGYADVIPVDRTVQQTAQGELDSETLVVAAALNQNYHATALDLHECYLRLGLNPPSERTLRRRLNYLRKEAIPYVGIENIGLTKTAVISLHHPSTGSEIARLLLAQASTLPKTRAVYAPTMTILITELPEPVEWFTLSQALSPLAASSIEMCTFIADGSQLWKSLESFTQYMISSISSSEDGI